jgi:protein phosphatase PTC1
VDLVRNMEDPVTASKLLVDHALNRFSTDNLSCMIVRLDMNQSKDISVEGEGTSEADKIVKDVKQKIADGSIPAVGVSGSNTTSDGDFVPTSLDTVVLEEEPDPVEEKLKPDETLGAEKPVAEGENDKPSEKA